MRLNNEKTKGDIGVTQVIADLTKKGYQVAIPIAEHLQYDLICHDTTNNKLFRLQVKYDKVNAILCTKNFRTTNGEVVKKYEIHDFEYYAIYLPDIDECAYIPNVGLTHMTVRTTLPLYKDRDIIWWEDYKYPTGTTITYRKPSDINPNFRMIYPKNTYGKRKVKNRPTKEELQTLIETTPYTKIGELYGVSDNAIRKWAKSYGILKNKYKKNLQVSD
jgi:hypothetical protein